MIYTKKRAFMAIKLTLILKTLAQLLGLLLTVVLVRTLSEPEYGAYNTFLSSMAVVGSVFSLGIGNTLQRFIPKYMAQREYSLAKKIIKISFYVRFASLVLLCAIGYFFRETIASWFNIESYVAAMVPFSLVVLLHFQSRLMATVLSACLFQGVIHTAQLILVAVKVVGYILLGFYNLGLYELILVDIAAYLLMLIVVLIGYWVYVHPLAGGRRKFEKDERRGVLRYAGFNNLNDVGVVSLGRDIDVMFLASMSTIDETAAYAFGNRLSHSLKQISPVRYFIDVIRPLFFTLDPIKDRQKVGVYFSVLLKLNYILEIPMACGLYVSYPIMVEYLFDGKFSEYRLLVVGVFTIVVASSLGVYVGLLAQLKERVDIILYSKIFSVLNLIGNLALIPILGAWGAIVSTLVTTLVKDIFVLWFVREGVPALAVFKFLLLSAFFWLGVVCFYEYLSLRLNFSLIVSFVFGCCLIGLAYFMYVRLNLFNDIEKYGVRDLIGKENKKLKLVGL